MAYLIYSYKSIDKRAPYFPVPQDISSSESEVDYVLPALPGEWPGDPTTPGGHTTVESTVSMRISDPTSSELTWGVHRRLGGLVERPMKRRESLTPPRRHVMIEALPEDALLNIFSFHQMSSPSHWHRLAHVCRKWRYIILESPRTLNLRLYCASGRLFLKSPDCWPALPIVLQYGGSPALDTPAPEDEDDIVAALSYCDRVSSINLTVTSSLLEKMKTIKEPFSELEELVLLSGNTRGLALPSGFRWGSRLRTLNFTRIASPELPQLLLTSLNLVDLRLHEIPSDGYFTPNEFANALSGMTQLRSLLLHFPSSPGSSRDDPLRIPSPSGERIVLFALTSLDYRGMGTYLDSFVDIIDAPNLLSLEITLCHQDVSRLCHFVNRIELHRPYDKADVLISRHVTSITFTQRETPVRISLQVSREPFRRQLSSISRICDHFSGLTYSVRDLSIKTTQCWMRPQSWHGVDEEQWLEFIRLFSGTERFYLDTELATDILNAFHPKGKLAPGVLHSLKILYVRVAEPLVVSWPGTASSFAASRRRAGRPVMVEYSQPTVTEERRRRTDQVPSFPGGARGPSPTSSALSDLSLYKPI